MKKKTLIILPISLVIISVIGIFIYFKFLRVPKPYFILNQNGVENKISLFHTPIVQKDTRKFVDKELNFLFEIGNEKDAPLFMPLRIRTDTAGNIYIQDTSDNSIKIYSPEGKFIKKLGRSGEGPGEFSQLYDFCLAPDNRIFALDYTKIEIFNGDKAKTIKLNRYGGVSAIAPLGNNEILLLQIPLSADGSILSAINSEGKETSSFEALYKSVPPHNAESALFHGELFVSSNNTILISPYFNLMFFFKGNKVDRVVTTVDKEEHPTLIVKSTSEMMSADVRKIKIVNYKSFLINDSLYIMSGTARDEYKKFIFDIYDTGSGMYSHSIRFDHKESYYTISLSNNRLFIIDKDFKVKVFGYE